MKSHKFMDLIAQESPVIQRTLDLCKAITEQPDFIEIKGRMDAFLANEVLKFQFQQVNELGGQLQMKQSQGAEIEADEIAHFESLRSELVDNTVVVDFLKAQKQLQRLHQIVGQFVDKTFELGRLPEYGEVHDGSCGDCDCH